MRWSKLRQSIESKFAASVKERVRLDFTGYRKAHDQESSAAIVIDDKNILTFSYLLFCREQYYARFYGHHGDAERDLLFAQNVFSSDHFLISLRQYLNLSIDEIIVSTDPIIRAIGMLDARLGKRRLKELAATTDIELVQRLWRLRCEAENIKVSNSGQPDTAEQPLNRKIATNGFSRRYKLEHPSPPDQIHSDLLLLDSRTRKIQKLLHNLLNDSVKDQEIDSPLAKAISESFRSTKDRAAFCNAIKLLLTRSSLFDEGSCSRAAIEIARDHESWRKQLSDWRPKSHNCHKQLASLLRHLYAQFEIPLFMDKAWSHPNRQHQVWYKHIADGKNIRSADGVPVILTKLMAHHFLLAPEHYSIEAAIRWGQIHAIGGDKHLCDALLDTRLAVDFANDDFWLSVLKFFVRNPMLDPACVNSIVDYIWSKKFEDRMEFIEAGVVQNTGPEQPNFTMHGRTVPALLRQVQEWHVRLGRETRGKALQWQKSNIKNWQFVEGNKESHNMRIYRIRELLSGSELTAEGRQLRHCVASYAGSCAKNLCTIWSLELELESGTEKLLTIELRMADLRIRQVRGLCNRRADQKEREIIQRWCSQEGLVLESFI